MDICVNPEGEESPSPSIQGRSRHSSALGPYRQHIPETQFPLFHPIATSSYQPAIYCRSLMSSGNGFPPWRVAPPTTPEVHTQQGPSIGDVGCIDNDGGFEYWFNIFNTKDHPIQGGSMPRNFRPIDPPLSEWRIQMSPDHFKPGSIISSEGVDNIRISDHPLELKFTSFAREGTVLILPEGMVREDLVETQKFYSYLKEHASDWYQFMNAYSDIPLLEPKVNSSLFLITGTDKTRIWDTAYFPPHQSDLTRPTVFHYIHGQDSGRSWESKYGSRIDWSSERATGAEGKFPCALFLRGISIALSKAIWAHGIAPIPVRNLPIYFIPSVPACGWRANLERFIRHLRRGPNDDDIDGKEAIFHPAIVLSQILLEIDPTAAIAVIEDSVWCPFLHGRSLSLSEFVKLVHKLLDNYEITTADGVVQFVPKQIVQLGWGQKIRLHVMLRRRSKKEHKALRKLKNILSKPPLPSNSE